MVNKPILCISTAQPFLGCDDASSQGPKRYASSMIIIVGHYLPWLTHPMTHGLIYIDPYFVNDPIRYPSEHKQLITQPSRVGTHTGVTSQGSRRSLRIFATWPANWHTVFGLQSSAEWSSLWRGSSETRTRTRLMVLSYLSYRTRYSETRTRKKCNRQKLVW